MNIEALFDTGIQILKVVAPLTGTEIDNLTLAALRALRNSPEFMAELTAVLNQPATDVPPGAMALIPPGTQPFIGGMGWAQLLPLLIEIIRILRSNQTEQVRYA